MICRAKAKMSPGTLLSVTPSRSFCNNVNLGLILAAGDWSNVSTPRFHYFRNFVPCRYTLQDAVQRSALEIDKL